MIEPSTFGAFLLATAVFAYVPGPGMLYVTAQTLKGGRAVGLRACLGTHLGGYVHVFVAAFCISALLSLFSSVEQWLRLIGALYLLWLAFGIFQRRNRPQLPKFNNGAMANADLGHSVLVEVLNPKTALFFVAFLPQFTHPSLGWPLWLQILALGSVVNLLFTSADVMCVFFADQVKRWFLSARHGHRIAHLIAAGLIAGLAISLLL